MDNQYLGTDPIYQNHAYDTDAPLSGGTAHEAVAKAWEDGQPVKSVDLAVNPNSVSALSDFADLAKPAVVTADDGTTSFNAPVKEAELSDAHSAASPVSEPEAEDGEASAPAEDDDPDTASHPQTVSTDAPGDS